MHTHSWDVSCCDVEKKKKDINTDIDKKEAGKTKTHGDSQNNISKTMRTELRFTRKLRIEWRKSGESG